MAPRPTPPPKHKGRGVPTPRALLTFSRLFKKSMEATLDEGAKRRRTIPSTSGDGVHGDHRSSFLEEKRGAGGLDRGVPTPRAPRCRTRTARSNHCKGKPIFKKWRPKLQFLDLPEDILCKILSELPLKEVIRTSVLSRRWRCIQKLNPKLRFDGYDNVWQHQYLWFRAIYSGVHSECQCCPSEAQWRIRRRFELKFELNCELPVHLDSWVRFVVASQAKNLAIDLAPAKFHGRNDRYLLPNELLDIRTTSRLQRIQLSFVSIKLPSQFSGFPNLKKLDLHLINVTAKDIEDMLSSCSNLEWLRIVRCHLDDELKVDLPLPRLLYLCVAHCRITRIKFNAMKLQTFECRGSRYPIDLTQSPELKDAHLDFIDSVTLDYALTTLPTKLPSVENLILQASASLKTPALLENACRFSQLKYLQLELVVVFEDVGNILSLASFLRAAPLIEKFELHFSVFYFAHLDCQPIRSLPRFPHNHLKNLYITGFIACTGQLEFLLHTVENAPVLEVLTLDPAFKVDKGMDYEGRADFFSQVREISRKHLSGRISPATKLCIL